MSLRQKPDFHFESSKNDSGFKLICGADEAGRGPLAGPVVAAAVILNPQNIPLDLDDSKRLTAKRRDELFLEIMNRAIAVSIGVVSATTIDRINILQASLQAMRNAIMALHVPVDFALIDGNKLPADLPCPAEAIIGGDGKSVSIAAASIIAKVTRDRMMTQIGQLYPNYGFASHKGYGSAPRHQKAIASHGGIERVHRMTFGALKK